MLAAPAPTTRLKKPGDRRLSKNLIQC
jgi:hypothetical protein